MKIDIVSHNPDWSKQFLKLKAELESLLQLDQMTIEHFGSTAVPGLHAKPVIDILVGITDIRLFPELVSRLLLSKKYVYYQVFDLKMPNRRLLVRIKDDWQGPKIRSILSHMDDIPHELINQARLAHIHIWKYQSSGWIRHIAFRDYLIAHPKVQEKYGQLKISLSKMKWNHGMEYNNAKNEFIKIEEAKALAWYLSKRGN